MIPAVAFCKNNVRVHEHFVRLICRHICETPVTQQTFIEQLHELHHKIDFAKEQSFKGALSVNDVGDVLEKLKDKVTSKDGTSCGCLFSETYRGMESERDHKLSP